MNLFEYTAYKNPNGASRLLHSEGIRPADDKLGLSRQLGMYVSRGGQNALDKVTDIHPDFKLIEAKVKASIVPEKKEHSNACGCTSNCSGNGSGFSSANGQDIKADVKSRLSEKPTLTEVIVTGGIVLIGLALVLKLMK
jgi:hypothetical protein